MFQAPGNGAPPPSTLLPPGWMAYTDSKTSREYYVHQPSGTTQWTRPAPAAARAPAVAPHFPPPPPQHQQQHQQQQQQHRPAPQAAGPVPSQQQPMVQTISRNYVQPQQQQQRPLAQDPRPRAQAQAAQPAPSQQPGMQQPGMQQLGMQQPGVQQPGVQQPMMQNFNQPWQQQYAGAPTTPQAQGVPPHQLQQQQLQHHMAQFPPHQLQHQQQFNPAQGTPPNAWANNLQQQMFQQQQPNPQQPNNFPPPQANFNSPPFQQNMAPPQQGLNLGHSPQWRPKRLRPPSNHYQNNNGGGGNNFHQQRGPHNNNSYGNQYGPASKRHCGPGGMMNQQQQQPPWVTQQQQPQWKRCCKCGGRKGEALFSKRQWNLGGPGRKCKTCVSAEVAEKEASDQKNPPQLQAAAGVTTTTAAGDAATPAAPTTVGEGADKKKVCSGCKEWFKEEDYSKRQWSSTGTNRKCRKCIREVVAANEAAAGATTPAGSGKDETTAEGGSAVVGQIVAGQVVAGGAVDSSKESVATSAAEVQVVEGAVAASEESVGPSAAEIQVAEGAVDSSKEGVAPGSGDAPSQALVDGEKNDPASQGTSSQSAVQDAVAVQGTIPHLQPNAVLKEKGREVFKCASCGEGLSRACVRAGRSHCDKCIGENPELKRVEEEKALQERQTAQAAGEGLSPKKQNEVSGVPPSVPAASPNPADRNRVVNGNTLKICASCRAHLPQDSFSKRQWSVRAELRKCKPCTAKFLAEYPEMQRLAAMADGGSGWNQARKEQLNKIISQRHKEGFGGGGGSGSVEGMPASVGESIPASGIGGGVEQPGAVKEGGVGAEGANAGEGLGERPGAAEGGGVEGEPASDGAGGANAAGGSSGGEGSESPQDNAVSVLIDCSNNSSIAEEANASPDAPAPSKENGAADEEVAPAAAEDAEAEPASQSAEEESIAVEAPKPAGDGPQAAEEGIQTDPSSQGAAPALAVGEAPKLSQENGGSSVEKTQGEQELQSEHMAVDALKSLQDGLQAPKDGVNGNAEGESLKLSQENEGSFGTECLESGSQAADATSEPACQNAGEAAGDARKPSEESS